jgi:hypothetical protein
MMKKALALLMASSMLISTLPATVFADDRQLIISVSPSTVSPGDAAVLTFTLTNSELTPINSLEGTINFGGLDPAIVCTPGPEWPIDPILSKEGFAIGGSARAAAHSGVIFTAQITIASSATPGAYSIEWSGVRGEDDDGNSYQFEGGSTALTVAGNTSVTTAPSASGTYGDSLSSIGISGAAISPEGAGGGTWAWTEAGASGIYPVVGGTASYEATYTPPNTAVYNTVKVRIVPTVSPKPIAASVNRVQIKYGSQIPAFSLDPASLTGLVGADTEADLDIAYSTTATSNSPVGLYNVTGTANNTNYTVTVNGQNALEIVPSTSTGVDPGQIPDNVSTNAFAAKDAADIRGIESLLSSPLPGSVTVTTDASSSAVLSVVWTASPTTVSPKGGTYVFTGELASSDGSVAVGSIENPVVTVSVAPVIAPPISFGQQNALYMNSGYSTTLTASGLIAIDPDLLPVSVSSTEPVSGQLITYSIDWDGDEEIDGTQPGSETFTGTIINSDAPEWLTIPSTASRVIVVSSNTVSGYVTVGSPLYYGEPIVPEAQADIGGNEFNFYVSGASNSGTAYSSEPLSSFSGEAGSYTIIAELIDPNLQGIFSAEFAIDKKPITASVIGDAITYGDPAAPDPVLDWSASGFAYGEDENDLQTPVSVQWDVSGIPSPLGSPYASNPLAGFGAADQDNYIVSLGGAGKLTVNKKPITVTIDNASRVYLDENPSFTYSFAAEDLVGSDTSSDLAITLSTAATSSSAAGDYAIDGSSSSLKYDVTFIPGKLTVNEMIKISQTTPVTVALSKTSGTVSETITASSAGGDGAGSYVYASSDTSVATVDADGVVTLVGLGTAAITAYRRGDVRYYDSPNSDPVTLTVADLPRYTVTVGASAGGTASGGGTGISGSTVTATAYPNSGYVFGGWYIGSSLHSRSNPLTYTIASGNVALEAAFSLSQSPSAPSYYNGGGSSAPETVAQPVDIGGRATLDKTNAEAYIHGYPDNTVKPDGNITRYEVAVILYSRKAAAAEGNAAAKDLGPLSDIFFDAKDNQWYSNAVKSLSSIGIISGYTDGTFKGQNNITFAELSRLIAEFTAQKDLILTGSIISAPKDHWAYYYLLNAENHGYLPDGYKADAYVTRGEFVHAINLLMGWEKAEPKRNSLPYTDIAITHKYYRDFLLAASGILE